MKRFPFFLCCIFLFFLSFCAVTADPDQVTLTKQSKYNYINVDGYGFYKKCEDYSWFVMVLNNDSKEPNTITFPKNASVTGWSGTSHPLKNFTYRVMDYGSNFWSDESRPEIPFNGTVTMPGHSSYAFFFDITKISQYNLYWNTDVFFKLTISGNGKSIEFPIQGVIAQHGNGCPEDEVCSAAILEGGYNSDGGDGRVVVNLKNDMRDEAAITLKPNLLISWKDSSGKVQNKTLNKAISWNKGNKTLRPGEQFTATGVFTLPVEIAVNPSLEVTTYFTHPSSLYFGDFEAKATIVQRGGAHGILDGNYSAVSGDGQILAQLTNHQDKPITIELPEIGTVKTSSGNKNVALRWNHETQFKLNAEEIIQLDGFFTFAAPADAASDKNMIMAIKFAYTQENGDTDSFTAAGNLTRAALSEAVIRSVAFCRDISADGSVITFRYALNNPSPIDVPVQLASTLSIDGVTVNPSITYTGCISAGENCFSRITKANAFTLKTGETATFIGKVSPNNYTEQTASIRTSLLYKPENDNKALYVGQASASCSSAAVSTALPTEASVLELPTMTPITIEPPVETSEPSQEVFVPDPTQDAPIFIPEAEETVFPESTAEQPTVVPSQTPLSATETPTSIVLPTESQTLPTAILPTAEPIADEAILSLIGHNGTYGQCDEAHDLNFSFTITNHGTAAGDFHPSELSFTNPDSGNKLSGITFTSCQVQSASGMENSCETELRSGSLAVFPGVSVTLGAAFSPESVIRENHFNIQAESSINSKLSFEVECIPNGNNCSASIAPILNEKGEALTFSIENGKLVITLTLENYSSDNISITPQTVYLHSAAISDYEGMVLIIPLIQKALDPNGVAITPGQAFDIPGKSSAELTLLLPLNALPTGADGININWNLLLGGPAFNFTGTAPAAAPLPTPTSAMIPPSIPAAPAGASSVSPSNVPAIPMGSEPRIGSDLGNLPETGFSSQDPFRADLQPDTLNYTGTTLHLEIPVLDVRSDIMIVPSKDDGNWDVEWLNDRSGILSGATKPGKGTALVAAHNSLNLMETGPFVFLLNLEKNDRIFLTDGDDRLMVYRVYLSELTNNTDANQIYEKAIPGSLVLVTCENELPEGGYAHHRLVYAEPLS